MECFIKTQEAFSSMNQVARSRSIAISISAVLGNVSSSVMSPHRSSERKKKKKEIDRALSSFRQFIALRSILRARTHARTHMLYTYNYYFIDILTIVTCSLNCAQYYLIESSRPIREYGSIAHYLPHRRIVRPVVSVTQEVKNFLIFTYA